jgi:SAM-dependent methyltransferase
MAKDAVNKTCFSCRNTGIEFIGEISPSDQFAGKYLEKLLPGGSLYRCKSCHLSFRWPRLSDEQSRALYLQVNLDNWQYNYEDRPDWNIAQGYLEENFVGGKILDIGCFDGGFKKRLSGNWTCYGVEIHEVAATQAKEKGIHIIARDYDDLKNVTTQFDAVVAFDMIEHVEDPRYFLQQIMKVTRPNGIIIVSTGDSDAPSWRFMGSRYWYCTISEHISFINENWCRAAAGALRLHLVHLEKYSHAGRNRIFSKTALESTINLIYKFFPGFFGWLRSIGLGNANIEEFPQLKSNPPLWISAKDHMIVVFRKL